MMAIETLADLFLDFTQKEAEDCLQHKIDGQFMPVSTSHLVERVERLATALRSLGVGSGDRVALMAENGIHWPTVDFATLCSGAVLVPIYPTLTPDQAAYVVNDSGARVVFVQGYERLQGLLEEKGDLSDVEHFVLIGDPSGQWDGETLDSLVAAAERDSDQLRASASAVDPEDLATFIYTSGTTGSPKGVMLTHRNLVSNVLACLEVMPLETGYTALSFLPLSHSFERTIDYTYFLSGTSIAYAESIHSVGQDLAAVRPHVFVSVPRVYEKVMAKVNEGVAASPALKRKIFNWARGVAAKALPYRLKEARPPGLLGIQLGLADRLVFSKIRARLGGRFRFAFSGGAPLAKDIAEFFWGAGVVIFEGYGLSETSPVLTVNSPGKVRLGTVGKAIPGVELQIASDGEILAKGPNIMHGYHNLAAATAEAIDDDGWFHTGDIGEIEEGFLRITDRKKELIVNAYGKNIAPAPIENALKASRYIGQAVVIGDRRKFLSALLVPDFDTLRAWAGRKGIDSDGLLEHPEVRTLFEREVAIVNEELARYEQVRKWALLESEFTIESGELTPTQKIKRRIVMDRHIEAIEGIYADAKA